jgi:hypothetical protein
LTAQAGAANTASPATTQRIAANRFNIILLSSQRVALPCAAPDANS